MKQAYRDLLWTVFLAAITATLLCFAPQALAQCSGGTCSRQPIQWKVKEKFKANMPTPAWRYERPIGHRAAVVRIYCRDDARIRSIGSGVLVRWGKRIVALTARHVVRDAKKIIIELHNKRTHYARVLKVDVTWDCAVLKIVGKVAGVAPAEVEFGQTALQRKGNRLESCGYGPDGKLAVNSGLFIGYRRSTQAAGGPDDWMVLSGHARGGDSGGPIFNQRGRLVGVLWGTDGEEVVGVQAGRLHRLLSEAAPQIVEKKAFVRVRLAAFERHPTPPMPGPEPYIEPAGPLVPVEAERTRLSKKPLLPWRGKAEDKDATQDARIDRLIDLAERQQAARNALAADVDVAIRRPGKTPEKPIVDGRSPLLAGLCMLAGVVGGFVVYFANQKD